METNHIAEGLIGKGVRAYSETNEWSSIVIPVVKEGVKVQRIYIKPDGTLTRGSDYKRTGELVGPALVLWKFLKQHTQDEVIEIWAAINTAMPKGEARTQQRSVSADDVMAAFDEPATTEVRRSVVCPADLG